ncbi:MAG: hypothetical protein ACKVTZ_01975 [Bacteroidia bacterium]
MNQLTTTIVSKKVVKDVQLITEGVFSANDAEISFSLTNPFQWEIENVSAQLVQLLPNQPRKVLCQQSFLWEGEEEMKTFSLKVAQAFAKTTSSYKQIIENEIDDAAATYLLNVYIESNKCNMQLMKEIFRVG